MKSISALLIFCVHLIPQMLSAQAPSLRDEISLNGIWKFTPGNDEQTTIIVPDYWDAAPGFTKEVEREFIRNGDTIRRQVTVPSTSVATYEREVIVPERWRNKVIRVEFEGINHIAEVYVNKKHLATHVGGWIPFSVDVTDQVKPGKSFILKVVVKGGDQSPVVDSEGNPQWPVGWFGHQSRWGIIFDTWLRAYGQVHINDAFIQTSWRNNSISVEYDLENSSAKVQEFFIQGDIRKEYTVDVDLTLESEIINLDPGEKRTIRLEKSWTDPQYWDPNHPNLNMLTSRIRQKDYVGGQLRTIDKEQRRFGFREIWIEGNHLMFNGHRLNLRGTSINTHGQGYSTDRYDYITEETWNKTIDRLQYLNIQCVRFHQQPPPENIIEIADERGLLVIEESPMYAREYILKSNNPVYFQNALQWINPWIRDRRNHPSIILWSSENEIGRNWLEWLSDAQLKIMADTIHRLDPTRPVIAEGDFDIGDDFNSLHYPEGVGRTVKGSIYSWDSLVVADKPTAIGEFLFGRTDGKEWWHGTWSRGLRYINVAQIMPYTLKWAWVVDSTTAVYENLKNSYAPIALFDKDYDDLGIDVIRKNQYPVLEAGKEINRNLILYNDDFEDTGIEVEVRLEADHKVIANDIRHFELPLGEHNDIICRIRVPELSVDIVDLVLITRKLGQLTFEEHKKFRVNNRTDVNISLPAMVKIGN